MRPLRLSHWSGVVIVEKWMSDMITLLAVCLTKKHRYCIVVLTYRVVLIFNGFRVNQ